MAVILGLDVEAVVFDCDGVLADTEPRSISAWIEALTSLGTAVSAEHIHAYVGRTDREIAVDFAARLGIPVDTVDRAAAEAFGRRLEGLTPFPDAVRLLDDLQERGIPVAAASNSFRWRLDAVLGAAELSSRFPVTVAADEVLRPKPAPDVYLEAVARLGTAPRHCLVVEDSPTGIRAARDAGCPVVAVDRGFFDPALLSEAARVVPSLDQGGPTPGRAPATVPR